MQLSFGWRIWLSDRISALILAETSIQELIFDPSNDQQGDIPIEPSHKSHNALENSPQCIIL